MVLTPEYWPPISHVAKLHNSAEMQLQTGGTYQKQSYLNRCKIAGVQGELTLSVPLMGGREQKTLFREVLIDQSQRWAVQHLRTLRSCYGKAPFFDYYFPTIETLLLQPCEQLAVLNERILQQLIRWLKWKGTIVSSTGFSPVPESSFIAFTPYVQVFADRQPFLQNLSILDLLFCAGSASGHYLQQLGQQFER